MSRQKGRLPPGYSSASIVRSTDHNKKYAVSPESDGRAGCTNMEDEPMPTLEWIGKDKVINHHQKVPFRVLTRKYSFDEQGQHEADNGSENMIIHGDNLEALKALLPRYEGRVKCIYIEIKTQNLIQSAAA